MSKNKKRFFFLSGLFTLIILGALLIVRLAQGYRPDLTSFSLQPRGMLVATSIPDGAQVFLNGKFTSATDQTLNLPPGEYEVEIKKEGYFPWKKTLPIKKELVMVTDAYLFSTFPNLSSLTFTGASRPVLAPDGQKVAYTVTEASGDQNGLWVLDLTDRPLGFGREPRLIVKSAPGGRDFGKASLVWSPDSKEILAALKDRPGLRPGTVRDEFFLLDTAQLNPETNLIDVSEQLPLIYKRWEKEKTLRETAKRKKLPKKFLETVENSIEDLIFSPDETKLMYTATASATISEEIIPPLPAANPKQENRTLEPGQIYVYDLKEDKNFLVMAAPEKKEAAESSPESEISIETFAQLSPPEPKTLNWLPTSKHFFYVQEDKITLFEYDNTNWVDVYTGPFENPYAFPFPGGDKILILTTLGANTPPNLYAISLR